ncbi:MAG: phosphonate C-P lyase system protein PhnL [Pseudomonadales bacterium]|jgi:alpha-D-ribose 1-methylphosphonate 5-triphosphate synthase subunit PhnL|nr:phosphonate C-P lyase system protein PhnL [Pseudomonadales bacterium]
MNDQEQQAPRVRVTGLGKQFRLYKEGEAPTDIPVFEALDLEVMPGECVVLAGASGVGKSTLMRAIYGNYLPSHGAVEILHDGAYVDIANCPPRQLLEVRRRTLGYVSQFLRVIPRIPTLQLVMEPLLENGVKDDEAEARARAILAKLRLPERHWSLPPATFSGGEQQRVNIARSFVSERPVMLLDEPTASLDAGNRETVVALVREALARGAAMVGIFHDLDVREAVATRLFDVAAHRDAA